MDSKRWGQAKREVIGLEPLIRERLKSGETTRQLWLSLKGEGRVSVSLSNFYIQLGRILGGSSADTKAPAGRRERRPVPEFLPPSIGTSRPAEVGASASDDPHFPPFIHNNRPDDESW